MSDEETNLSEVKSVIYYLIEQLTQIGYTKERVISDISKSTGIREDRVLEILDEI